MKVINFFKFFFLSCLLGNSIFSMDPNILQAVSHGTAVSFQNDSHQVHAQSSNFQSNSLSQPQSSKTIPTNSRSITLAARSVFTLMIRTAQESRSQDSYDPEQQCFRSSRKYFHDQAIRHHVQNKAVTCHHRRF